MASSDGKKARKFLKAISSGNLVKVKEVAKELNEGKIKEIRDEDGDSVLHLAAFDGRTNICQYFVQDLGFHVDSTLSQKGETPLFYAVMKSHAATAKYLISRGANPAVWNIKGITPLHQAARHGHIKLVKYLLSLGVPVDGALKNAPFTPLMVAAQCGQPSAVKFDILKCLLEAGADPNVCSIYGQLPIETEIMGKNRNIIEMFFPLTSPIPEVDDWSMQGILQYVNSDAFFEKNKEVLENSLANLKRKGDDSFKKKEYMTASIFYSKAIGLGQMIGFGDAVLYSNRSLCWNRLREADQALEDALMAHRLMPEWPKAYYRIGAALMLLEDYKQASEAFLDGLLLDPTNTEMRKAHREALGCMMKSCFGEERVN